MLAWRLLLAHLVQRLTSHLALHQVRQLVVVILLPLNSFLAVCHISVLHLLLEDYPVHVGLLFVSLVPHPLLHFLLLLLFYRVDGVLLLLLLVLLVQILAVVEDVFVELLVDELVDS